MIADKKAEINILFSCYFNKIILVGWQISANSSLYIYPYTIPTNTYRTLNIVRAILCTVQHRHVLCSVLVYLKFSRAYDHRKKNHFCF